MIVLVMMRHVLALHDGRWNLNAGGSLGYVDKLAVGGRDLTIFNFCVCDRELKICVPKIPSYLWRIAGERRG